MMENFSELNTAALLKEECLSVAIQSEETRDFSPTLQGYTVGLSSGTSGHRGLFLVSSNERWMHAGTMLAKVLPGSLLQPQRIAFFLRANSNLYTASKSRHLQFEFFDMLAPMDSHLAQLQSYQPTLIFAPPSLLRQLADRQIQGKLNLTPLKVVSVAETLDPLDEQIIQEAFHQKVHQVYQCTEGFLGITCSHGKLHLNEDCVHIEKDYLEREAGKFVPIITDFSRTTQPIIRYRLNDILTESKEPCVCGSPLQAIDTIEGRCDDMIDFESLDGTGTRKIFPDFIRRCVLFASDQIQEYRIRQFNSGTLEIALQASTGDLSEIQAQIQSEFNKLATQLKCHPPKISFRDSFETLGLKKLRRVERVHE